METIDKQRTVLIASVETSESIAKAGQAEVYAAGATAARLVAAAQVNLDEVFATVNQYVDAAAAHLRPGPDGPAATSLEFGIKIKADGNILLVRAGADLHMKVTVHWKRDETGSAAHGG